MRTISFAVLVMILTSGCVTSVVTRESTAGTAEDTPPQLWSHHKQLAMPVGVCADRAFNVLKALGYTEVVKNGNFSYGNSKGNRAAVKCVESGEGSFVYFAVAGPERNTVERLRNQISQNL